VNPDFLVIGAGVVGLASAWELASTGASVLVIDRGQPGREASWAGGGILHALLPWDCREEVISLIAHSTDMYRDWVDAIRAASAIDPEYVKTGVLVLPPFDETRARCWASERRVALEIVSPEEIVPGVGRAEHALWLGNAAQVRNPRLIDALVEALKRCGVNIVSGEEMGNLQITDNAVTRVIGTTGNSWTPGSIIVAAGAWSGNLLSQLSGKLDIFPVRGQMLLYRLAPYRLKTILVQNDYYAIPRSDGHILVGSTKEHVGFDARTTQAGRRELEQAAARLFPPLAGLLPIAHWAGLRPGSPDNIPTIARHPQITNLYVNAGHYRYGLTMAPGSARLLANLIHGREQPIDVSPYDWPREQPTSRSAG
jgi:glycine oxidase